MKSYQDFTNEDYQRIFGDIAENTYVFDDIQFNADCIRQQIKYCLENGDEKISSTAFHMAKVIQYLDYWGIIRGRDEETNI